MAKRKQCYSGIGGQAVLEGIMMKNGDKCAVAVRKSDGTIDVKTETYKSTLPKNKYTTLPFIRGVVNFIDSLMLGMKSLNYATEMTMDEVDEEPSRLEKWINQKFGDKANDIIMMIAMVFAVVFAIGLFMVLPYALSALLGVWVHNKVVLSLAEAIMRFAIFIGYVVLIGKLEDIERLYMYHGAEHKCIDCIEKGRVLSVHEVMRSSRLHPRCGTSFMLYVMAISCVLFFFINTRNAVLRLVFRLILIPVIAGISYEIIRLAGKVDNVFTRAFSKPGLMLQKLTTKEPTKEMVEVAIKAVEAVFDWKAFLKDSYGYEVKDAWLKEDNEELTDEAEFADDAEDFEEIVVEEQEAEDDL